MSQSPVIPIRGTKRRRCNIIESDSEPEVRNPTPASSPVRQATRDSPDNQPCTSTPCGPAGDSGYLSSWWPNQEAEVTEHVITFVHNTEEATWDSEESSLDTSTPGYKRGVHDDDEPIRELIRKQGLRVKLPKWMTRARPASVHVLADTQLGEWPVGDRYCRLSYQLHLPMSQWVAKIKNRSIVLKEHTVVLYIQKLRYSGHLTPLKNRLAQLCRAICGIDSDIRIFVCDTLPGESILDMAHITKYNKDLFIAMQHVNREYEQVFYLSMQAHFFSQGEAIQPWEKYFKGTGDLTALGCLTFRSCMIREVGISNYSL